MSDLRANAQDLSEVVPALKSAPGKGNWKPVLTLLLLSPAIGELLSGSSPPAQFFNPVSFLMLVALYGCGALLVRETVQRFRLNVCGLLLLGAAYAIVGEGLTCKSFFNPCWKDVGYLSIYGRGLGVSWLLTIELTVYHTLVSITVPIFLTQALFAQRAAIPWLRRRGWTISAICLGLVTLLGFAVFDSPEFQLVELKDPSALAREFREGQRPLETSIRSGLGEKSRAVLAKNSGAQPVTSELRHALVDELNRLLPRRDLYTAERFAAVPLTNDIRRQLAASPKDDKLVELNRKLLEQAFPEELAQRTSYPFRPAWPLTLGCVIAIVGLITAALRQTSRGATVKPSVHPWLNGLCTMLAFAVIGFVLPGLVENGLRLPTLVTAALWAVFAVPVVRSLRRLDNGDDCLWRRGLWALGVLTPWVFFATLLGLVVQFQGAKSFSGMFVVAIAAGAGIILLAVRWRRKLKPAPQPQP